MTNDGGSFAEFNEGLRNQAAAWGQLGAELDRARDEAEAEEEVRLQREVDALETSHSMLAVQERLLKEQAALVQSSVDQSRQVQLTVRLTYAVLFLTALSAVFTFIGLFL